MPLRRFFLNTRIFGPRDSPSTTPTTFTLATNGRAGEHLAAVLFEKQHAIDAHFVARLGVDPVDLDDGPRDDLDLTAAAFNDCEHPADSLLCEAKL
jgi:hypothetical protein